MQDNSLKKTAVYVVVCSILFACVGYPLYHCNSIHEQYADGLPEVFLEADNHIVNKDDSRMAKWYMQRAYANIAMRQPEYVQKALEDYERAKEASPRYHLWHVYALQIPEALAISGHTREAFNLYEKMLASALVLQNDTGTYDEFRKELFVAEIDEWRPLQQFKEGFPASNILKKVRYSFAFFLSTTQDGDLFDGPRALEMAKILNEQEPDNVYYTHLLAYALAGAHQFAEAKESLQKVKKLYWTRSQPKPEDLYLQILQWEERMLDSEQPIIINQNVGMEEIRVRMAQKM